MWKIDNSKKSYKEIEKQPGKLSAQITMNTLVQNKFKLWFIGSPMGDRLFNIILTNGISTTPAWTSYGICKSFINRENMKLSVLKIFGKNVVAVKMSLFHLQSALNPMNVDALEHLIINPNSSDFFIPFPMLDFQESYFRGKFDSLVDSTIKEIKAKFLQFNDEERLFEEIQNEDPMDGGDFLDGIDDGFIF